MNKSHNSLHKKRRINIFEVNPKVWTKNFGVHFIFYIDASLLTAD